MGSTAAQRGYPAHWEADVVLRDGAAAQLRPVWPEDASRLQRMHAAQSESSRYLRYFSYKAKLSDAELDRFTDVDHADRVCLVVIVTDRSGESEIIGVGGYDRIDGTEEAEVAFYIADAHQGRGLGSILLEHLAAAGRERGLARFSAEVLPANRKMLSVFHEAGYELTRSFEEDVIMVSFSIDPNDRSRQVMESREHRAEARSVSQLLAPEQVAVIGNSRLYGSVGYHLLHHLMEARYTGGVHSVSPEAYEPDDEEGPRRSMLEHIEPQIDLAVIAVEPDQMRQAVTDCGRAGVRGVLIVTETDGERQRELVRLARGYGMRVIGPASMGLISTDPDYRLNASRLPQLPIRGGAGIFSQSASVGLSLTAQSQRRSLGLTAAISAGNRADVSGNDAMQHFEDDAATRAVGIHLESFGNPRKFARIARRLSQAKPVVVSKSEVMGLRVPPGHETRTISAPAAAVDAMLQSSGVIQVANTDSLMDVLQVLATQPVPASPRLGILTNSPSMGRLLADAAEAEGLIPVRVDTGLCLEGTEEEARAALQHALQEQFDDDALDGVALCLQPTITGVQYDFYRAISQIARQQTKPMVMSLIGVTDPHMPLNFIGNAGPVIEDGALQQGVPVFSSPARSVAVLGKITAYQQWRERGIGTLSIPEGLAGSAAYRTAEERIGSWLPASGTAVLSQEQTAELLGIYGIQLLGAEQIRTADEACEAARRIGYPVALKSTNAYLRQRLDLGGVQLNIEDEADLRRAVAETRRALAPYAGSAAEGQPDLEVQAMAPAGQACTVRALEDPLIGAVISFGISGDAVDLLEDWAYAVPPLTDQDLDELIRGPKAAVKLTGHRGVPAVDLGAVQDVVHRVATLKDNHPEVAELELTPLLASAEGIRVLHATVRLAQPEQRTDSPRRAISKY
ncbi:bifunctional GNAT family N-acetyltransferase/acetate--CoA ligase family protein [Nesterenkonia populi]|uniref:bifunctional GNAT family N-acetyltransferase/acetate--CoA ligase family protein n=1 Tax=Nesterenkonia populi TaxID=1591087 RepID=UPI0011BDFAB0|nr:bifunctional GNAT family N-acetyltransferase/acetate--CoA ligase family protein [Nesterenkonia populi]